MSVLISWSFNILFFYLQNYVYEDQSFNIMKLVRHVYLLVEHGSTFSIHFRPLNLLHFNYFLRLLMVRHTTSLVILPRANRLVVKQMSS